jgi:hypothetical protein
VSREAARIVALERAPDADDLGLGAGLRPVQIQALSRIKAAGGGIVAAGVGHGKFLISIICPTVLESKRALLLVPPPLLQQTRDELAKWREIYPVIDGLTVAAYSTLSTMQGRRMLLDLAPDLIVADEAHALRRLESARTKRLIEYFQKNESARFVALSGTMTARSLKDFSHLSEIALRHLSPVPRSFRSLRSWSRCVDVRPDEPPTAADYREIKPLTDRYQKKAREAFRERFSTAPGVVATTSQGYDGSLVFAPVSYDLAPVQEKALDDLENLWRTPDGRDLCTAAEIARTRRQILTGYYTRWSPMPPREWLAARSIWSKAAREYLTRNRSGLDSLGLVAKAAERGEGSDALLMAWAVWEPVKDYPEPPTIAVWLTGHVVDLAVELAKTSERPALLWSESPHILDAIGDRLPCYGGGVEPDASGSTSIALSRRAHGTGRNLQAYSENITIGLPPNGATFEQLIGRTHRTGQQADTVQLRYMTARGVGVAKEKASLARDAKYTETMTGQATKYNAGAWIK